MLINPMKVETNDESKVINFETNKDIVINDIISYLISNYSEYLFKKHTDPLPFRKIIDGGIVSYQMGAIKPEVEIYTHLIKKYELDPRECIFFDDIEANVEAARSVGIMSRLITSEEDLLSELENF